MFQEVPLHSKYSLCGAIYVVEASLDLISIEMMREELLPSTATTTDHVTRISAPELDIIDIVNIFVPA